MYQCKKEDKGTQKIEIEQLSNVVKDMYISRDIYVGFTPMVKLL